MLNKLTKPNVRKKKINVKIGNYKQHELITSGQQRTDIIPRLKNRVNKLNNQIVFFTQPHPDSEERVYAANCILKSFKDYPDLDLIIKLHPAEIDDIYSKLTSQNSRNHLRFNGLLFSN